MADEIARLVHTFETDIQNFAEWMAAAQRELDMRAAEIERRQRQMQIMIRIHGIGHA